MVWGVSVGTLNSQRQLPSWSYGKLRGIYEVRHHCMPWQLVLQGRQSVGLALDGKSLQDPAKAGSLQPLQVVCLLNRLPYQGRGKTLCSPVPAPRLTVRRYLLPLGSVNSMSSCLTELLHLFFFFFLYSLSSLLSSS